MTSNDPTDAFVQSLEKSRQLLQELQAQIDGHLGANPDHINWAHVGDAKYIETELAEIAKHSRPFCKETK